MKAATNVGAASYTKSAINFTLHKTDRLAKTIKAAPVSEIRCLQSFLRISSDFSKGGYGCLDISARTVELHAERPDYSLICRSIRVFEIFKL